MLANTVLKQSNSVELEDVCCTALELSMSVCGLKKFSPIVFDLHFQCFSSEKLYVVSDIH